VIAAIIIKNKNNIAMTSNKIIYCEIKKYITVYGVPLYNTFEEVK